MKYVRPRHGIILAGIPATGAEVTEKLAKEWIAAGLVEEIVDPARPRKRPATPARKDS